MVKIALRAQSYLLLMERDAWMNRPSVYLSKELKQQARLLPSSPVALFGEKLGDLADKSANHKHTALWLHTEQKQASFASATKTAKAGIPKNSTVSTSGGGKSKQYKKKGKSKSKGKSSSGKGTKCTSGQSGFRGQAAASQQS